MLLLPVTATSWARVLISLVWCSKVSISITFLFPRLDKHIAHSFKVWVHRIYRVGLLPQTHAQSDLQSWVKLCEYDIQGREGRYLSIVYSSEKLSRYDLILISRKVSWKVARIVLFVFRIVQTDVRLLCGGNEKESIPTSVILLEQATYAPEDGEGETEWELPLVSLFAPSCGFWSV